ncbi:peptidase M48 family protein [Sphingomonas sp. KR1UV-12]|uniref:Peptidase M48 family protein n=1 Tax=Sphingomonas aurea TaxID=3063994 RepID=A0ABT9EIP5_9SPHN|nr:peptidase M48 family protein [Sphingomonas sp. KR1UV-12]MDP1026683.1 peptidase M48 family protein [Sphingomonas sp. KR1UV-12]
MSRFPASAAALVLLIGAAPPSAEDRAVARADAMLARIGYRLATGNAALCDRLAPTPGWLVQAVDQYLPQPLPAGAKVDGFPTPVAVALVVPEAPAARAGVMAGDGLAAVAGTPPPTPPAGPPSTRTRDAAQALVERQPADRPLAVTLRRDGTDRSVSIPASPGCRATFEVVPGKAMTADSDGQVVRIGVRFFDRYDEAAVAAVVAHELAHIVLRHRERLAAAGVSWGLFSELGRNGRLFRRTEDEADLLGVALLRNGGWDPAAASRFWRDHGGDVDGGLFRSRTHAGSKTRAAAIDAAIAGAPADRGVLWRPAVLATRDQPLS